MSFKFRGFFVVLFSIKCAQSALLYPQFTVMQLIGSLSVPVVDLPKDRKVFFDWGLQMNYDMPFNISSFYTVPIWPTNRVRSFTLNSREVHEHDFTAKELYVGLEEMLMRYGFDRSCLQQSICEISQNPFDEANPNVIIDVINFFLKPSIHQGFSPEEIHKKTPYELAETQGFLGANCQDLYPQCTNNLFNILTTF